ncbi:MAG TPA: hypothetical protein DCY94_03735, partial [Firmicutes bacterium]|nr:hypothetical protein [Bacillota bacterium]
GLSLMRILGSASRAIGLFKQISPIIGDFKPIISQVPKFYNKLAQLRQNASNLGPTLKSKMVLPTNDTFKLNSFKNSGPTFFQ